MRRRVRTRLGFLRTPARALVGIGLILICVTFGVPLRNQSNGYAVDVASLNPVFIVGVLLLLVGVILWLRRVPTPRWWPMRERDAEDGQ